MLYTFRKITLVLPRSRISAPIGNHSFAGTMASQFTKFSRHLRPQLPVMDAFYTDFKHLQGSHCKLRNTLLLNNRRQPNGALLR